MPPAPGWLSTMIGWPSAFARAPCAARVIASTPEPDAFGRMKRTGLSDCANEGANEGRASPAASPAIRVRRLIAKRVIACLLELFVKREVTREVMGEVRP